MNRLDLVPFYINRHRKLQSKWLSLSCDDIILLAGYDLDDDCEIKFQQDRSKPFIILGDEQIIITSGLIISVKKLGKIK